MSMPTLLLWLLILNSILFLILHDWLGQLRQSLELLLSQLDLASVMDVLIDELQNHLLGS